MDFISSNAFSAPPKPASASATIGASQCGAPSFCDSAQVIWSARSSALLIRRTTAGHGVGRVQALVRVGLAGQVRVGGDLPAGQVDGLQAGLYLLNGLVAGQRAERVDVAA